MPFWKTRHDHSEPRIVLQQVGPNEWCVLEEFFYSDGSRIFPIRKGSETDLASVKWPLWWLVASYGRHTRAALLHDELIDPAEDYPMKVPRREADRLLFMALKESGFGPPEKERRPSWLRRWFIWAAVAAIGTMGSKAPARAGLFLAHVTLFLTLLGLWVFDHWFGDISWFDALGWWPLNLWQSIILVGAAGLLWAFDPLVDTRLGFRLFLVAAVAVVVALPVAILAFVAALVVGLGDFVYNLGCALRERDFSLGRLVPIITPYRDRGRF
jgi:hypothetical protein